MIDGANAAPRRHKLLLCHTSAASEGGADEAGNRTPSCSSLRTLSLIHSPVVGLEADCSCFVSAAVEEVKTRPALGFSDAECACGGGARAMQKRVRRVPARTAECRTRTKESKDESEIL